MNLSRMDLMDQNIMSKILKNDQENQLNYEVTESAYMSISDNANQFLSQLHHNGSNILVDDFGSGVSSLSTIRDFEFDIIKNIGYSQTNDSILSSFFLH